MDPSKIESNIVLQTVLPQPKGKGFESLHSQLNKIEKKLERLSAKEYTIKVKLDDSDLSRSNLKIVSTLKDAGKQAASAVKQAGDAINDELRAATAAMRQSFSQGGQLTRSRTVQRRTKDGFSSSTTDTREDIGSGLQTKSQITTDAKGVRQLVEETKDLAAAEAILEKKRQERLAKRNAELDAARKRRELANDRLVGELGARGFSSAGRKTQFDAVKEESQVIAQRFVKIVEAFGEVQAIVAKVSNGKLTEETFRGKDADKFLRFSETGRSVLQRRGQEAAAAKQATKEKEKQQQIADEASLMKRMTREAQEQVKAFKAQGFILNETKESMNAINSRQKESIQLARSMRNASGEFQTTFADVFITGKRAGDVDLRTATGPRAEAQARQTASGRDLFKRELDTSVQNIRAFVDGLTKQGYQFTKLKLDRVTNEVASARLARVRNNPTTGIAEASVINANLSTGKAYEEISAGVEAERVRRSMEDKDAIAAVNRQRNRRIVTTQANKIQNEGFNSLGVTSTIFDRKSGTFQEIEEFRRVSGNAFRGYTVEIAKVNLATQEMRTQLLSGAAASRALGDGLAHAVAKVGMWSIATGTVFLATRGFYELAQGVTELQKNSTLLARVGRELGGGFSERQAEAKGLTQDILQMTAAIGGNAEEAVKSAAVYARAGQSRVEITQSVRASLLAARIAELDIAESTELMSSAMQQFQIPARNSIQTLDTLNTLSNNYRVTTGDLLQAISRSGSIIAQQNGRLSELAAVTAITAQSTSRSGSEIGNAVKTIASQIDRIETKKYIFEELGIAVHDVGGESKSYTQFLLEMSLALNSATDAERNLATTQVAGVRQRNILLSQMRDIVDIIKAENVALLGVDLTRRKASQKDENAEFGSSITEFLQTSDTLEASLTRLRSQVIATTNELSGGFVELGKDMSDILAVAIKLVSTGNKLTGGWLPMIATITAIAVAMNALALTYNLNVASIKTYVAGLYTQIQAQIAAKGATQGLATAIWGSTAAFIKANAAFLALAAIGYIVLDVFGAYAQKEQLLGEIEEARKQRLDRVIAQEQNRAKAYRQSGEAVISMALAIQRLRAEEQKQGVDNSPAINKIKSDIQEVSASAGLGIASGDSVESIRQKVFEKETQAIIAEQKATQQKVGELTKKRDEINKKLGKELSVIREGKQVQSILKEETSGYKVLDAFKGKLSNALADAPAFRERFSGTGIKGLTRSALAGTTTELGLIESEIIAAQSAFGKLTNEEEEATKELTVYINRLKDLQKQSKLIAENREEYNQAISKVSQFARNAEENDELRSTRNAAEDLIDGNETQKIVRRYLEIKEATREAGDALIFLKSQRLNNGEAEQAEKALLANLEEEKKLYIQIQQLRIKSKSQEFAKIIGSDSLLRNGSFRIASERQRGLSDTASSYNDQVAAIETQRRGLMLDNQELQRQALAVSNSPGRNLEERENRALQMQSIKLKIAENLGSLRDMEAQKALAILDAEKNIAIARKQSADEAVRALGTLSREDKLRALAQAQYFARNPNAKVSLQDQFLMSADDNRIGQQFFQSRFADGSLHGGLGRLFGLAGIGQTRELDKAENELGAFAGGRTRQQLLLDAQHRGLAFGRQQAVAEGNDAKNNALAFNDRNRGGIPQPGDPNNKLANLDLTVKHVVDFAPLAGQIERAYENRMQEVVDEITKDLKDWVDRRMKIAKKIPAVAN